MEQINFWEFFAGLGIFLLGMSQMEEGLAALAGRVFKKMIRKYTQNPVAAILSGTVITTVLQSSSVVSLMVLAFVGARVIELRSAIGIIIGSNLGTTFTGWMVAYLGFSVDIENIALPGLAIGGMGMVFFLHKEKLFQASRLLAGIGFLFLGLNYMKLSIELFAQTFDVTPFAVLHPYWLFVVGFVLTAIIQSSSAALVITLSALNAGIIPLVAAAAMVIGSDLGTTMTTMLGSLNGTPAKKRVALSHFLFNLIVDVLSLIFLFPLLQLVLKYFAFDNPLMSLVAFHSSFNLLGVFLFLPFISVFARFLEKRFEKENTLISKFINEVPVKIPEAALMGLKKEVKHLQQRIFHFQLSVFHIYKKAFYDRGLLKIDDKLTPTDQYQRIKELEGKLVEFYLKIHHEKLNREESLHIRQLILSIRYAMTSAKGIKDIEHNILEFRKTVNDDLLLLYNELINQQSVFFLELFDLYTHKNNSFSFEKLADLKKRSKDNYNILLEKAYQSIRKDTFTDLEISTLFNVNREIHSANKALIQSIKEVVLEEEMTSSDFDMIPN